VRFVLNRLKFLDIVLLQNYFERYLSYGENKISVNKLEDSENWEQKGGEREKKQKIKAVTTILSITTLWYIVYVYIVYITSMTYQLNNFFYIKYIYIYIYIYVYVRICIYIYKIQYIFWAILIDMYVTYKCTHFQYFSS